ncbi:PTS transporter subunit EIIC [Enterococcus sp. AZ194]|uniref:PTS transporter subunit EIIC n=1 Tax=Enterococcus sp. AZ194 TaxID=2774629 RepID=UPI003F689612
MLENYQPTIVERLGALEKNKLFTSTKQTFLKLNFLLLLSSALMMVKLANRQFINSEPLEQSLTYLIHLLTNNYGLAFVVVLAVVYMKSSQNLHFLLTNLIVYSAITSSVSETLAKSEFQLLMAMLTVLISLPLIYVYERINQFLKKKIQLPMEVLDNVVLIIYFGSLFLLIKGLSTSFFLTNDPSGFFEVINIDHPLAVFLIVFVEMLLWYLGINGYGILVPFVLFFAIHNLNANLSDMNQGLVPKYIFTPNFWDYFVSVTGGGLVGALAVLSYFSKKKKLHTLGKSSIVGNLFSVSEPIVFGLPIVMNKYFFVPFVIGTPLIGVGQWYVFKWGWVNLPTFFVADFPLPFSSLLATLDWRSLLLVVATLLVAIVMYLPFFKKYEQSVEEEKAEKKYDDLDLDF